MNQNEGTLQRSIKAIHEMLMLYWHDAVGWEEIEQQFTMLFAGELDTPTTSGQSGVLRGYLGLGHVIDHGTKDDVTWLVETSANVSGVNHREWLQSQLEQMTVLFCTLQSRGGLRKGRGACADSLHTLLSPFSDHRDLVAAVLDAVS